MSITVLTKPIPRESGDRSVSIRLTQELLDTLISAERGAVVQLYLYLHAAGRDKTASGEDTIETIAKILKSTPRMVYEDRRKLQKMGLLTTQKKGSKEVWIIESEATNLHESCKNNPDNLHESCKTTTADLHESCKSDQLKNKASIEEYNVGTNNLLSKKVVSSKLEVGSKLEVNSKLVLMSESTKTDSDDRKSKIQFPINASQGLGIEFPISRYKLTSNAILYWAVQRFARRAVDFRFTRVTMYSLAGNYKGIVKAIGSDWKKHKVYIDWYISRQDSFVVDSCKYGWGYLCSQACYNRYLEVRSDKTQIVETIDKNDKSGEWIRE